jgi:Zn2+/Cd2+-exporting ATPase
MADPVFHIKACGGTCGCHGTSETEADHDECCNHDHAGTAGSGHKVGHPHDCCAAPADAIHVGATGSRRTRLRIMAMDCPTEARLIENALSGMPGLVGLHFDFFERVLTLEHDAIDLEHVMATIGRIGMKAVPVDSLHALSPVGESGGARLRFLLSGLGAALAEVLAWTLGDQSPTVMVLALLSIALGGLPTLSKGWVALRARALNIHVLMTLAVAGAMLLRQWPEAAMVLFLFALAERLEARSLQRAGAAVRELMSLAPETARIADGQGGWREVAVGEVMPGARVRVSPGERVPLDGEIASGRSAFDEASITGESLPRDKGPGERVFAGSINGQGVIDLVTTSAADGSVLARIIDSVRDAQSSRAPTQRFIDRFARIYTPVVVVLAVLFAVLPPLFGLMPAREAFYQALVMLVIACPCAMVIATPVTLVSALASAARHGLLIKGGDALERAATVRAVAFDKTGTLTRGRPAVVDVRALGALDADRVLTLAAALDAHSTHPLALALRDAALEGALDLPEASHVRERAGLGVEGEIAGESWRLGSRRLLDTAGAAADCMDAFERQGFGTLVLIGADGKPAGVIAVADEARTEAAAAISALAAQGVYSVILSGDNPAVVERLARVTGVADAHGGLLPQDKLDRIDALQLRHGAVAMVGDGVNDAPALARAELGIAMGAASDTALETAAVALMDNRLDKLATLFAHARRTMRVLRFNLGLALAIKLVFFGLALTGLATLWMAVFADVGASLLVVGNGLRLARSLDDQA